MSEINGLRGLRARVGLQFPRGLEKFLMVGMLGLVVDLGVFTLLQRFGVSYIAARAISIPLATVVTWALNRRLTFAASGRKAHIEALRYGLVTLVAQSVNYLVMLAVALADPSLPKLLAAFAGSVTATIFSYTGQRFFTFAPTPNLRQPQ